MYHVSGPLVRGSTPTIRTIRACKVCAIYWSFPPFNAPFILEQIHADFPFWEECHRMWHKNPVYSAQPFNAAPGTNRFDDFLSIINCSGSAAASAQNSGQTQLNDQDDTVDSEHHGGTVMSMYITLMVLAD